VGRQNVSPMFLISTSNLMSFLRYARWDGPRNKGFAGRRGCNIATAGQGCKDGHSMGLSLNLREIGRKTAGKWGSAEDNRPSPKAAATSGSAPACEWLKNMGSASLGLSQFELANHSVDPLSSTPLRRMYSRCGLGYHRRA
jgi:hypothetical protein